MPASAKNIIFLLTLGLNFLSFKYHDIWSVYCGQKYSLQKNDTIHWSSNSRLKYDDFQGIPRPKSDSGRDTLAICAYSIKYNLKKEGQEWMIEAFAVFEKNNSWIKERSPWVLKHEQGHFDIGEIYAMQFERKVNEAHIKEVHEFLAFLTPTFKEIAAECNAEQEKYDIQTMNTLGRESYSKWIGQQLDSLAKGR